MLGNLLLRQLEDSNETDADDDDGDDDDAGLVDTLGTLSRLTRQDAEKAFAVTTVWLPLSHRTRAPADSFAA